MAVLTIRLAAAEVGAMRLVAHPAECEVSLYTQTGS